MGIAKAGKTSILLALDNKTEEFTKVKPTPSISYNQILWAGFSIALWDVGGQKVYLKKFLLENDRYLLGLNAIFFVISVEEEDSFKDAFTLLKNLVDFLEKMKLNVSISFFLHKLDPNRREMEIFQKNEKELRSKVAKIMGRRPYEVFTTSIYDRLSIVRAFTATIQKFVPQYDLILSRLQDLSQEFSSPMVLILDENSNTVGEWHDPKDTRVDVQLFTEICFSFSKIISRRIYPDLNLLEMSPAWEIAAVPFLAGSKVYIGFVQIARNAVAEGTAVRAQLLAKREDFGKMLDLFNLPKQ